MHEMSLCESVLQLLQDHAVKQGFSRVKTVWLEIGDLAGVEVDAMRFCFDAVVRDTLAHDAMLEIVQVNGEAWCMLCAKSVRVKKKFDQCPDCGSYQLQITGGDQMKLKELEVE